VRALALLLAVAVPASSFAYGPTDEQIEPVRAPPSAKLLPQTAPAPQPASPEFAAAVPLYKHWALWAGLGTLTAGLIAVVLIVIAGAQHPPVPVHSAPSAPEFNGSPQ
jgi:hypothetical protein